ncbi:MAG: hypothetical protein K9I47_10175 [Bacteroidales bacterium]|nr:hypothetical protein [Bacteroidales bacterium]
MKQIIAFCFLVISTISVNAAGEGKDNQDEESSPKFYAGGNLGLQFGTITLIDVSPWISYRVIPQFSIGVGGTYKYYRYGSQFISNQNTTTADRTYHYYGGRLFSRYYPKSESIGILNALFLHAEYEILELQFDTSSSNQRVESVFGGAGFQIPLGEHVYGDIYLLYDFNKSGYSPYKNPLLRVGVNVGL